MTNDFHWKNNRQAASLIQHINSNELKMF